MQKTTTEHHANHDEIEISITDVAKSLYEGRWFILLFTSVCVAAALGVAFITAQYKSSSFWYFEGLVKQTGEGAGISLSEYNRIMDSAKKRSRFKSYLEAMKIDENLPEVELLCGLFASREGIATQIKPFRSALLESKLAKDAPILGVSLDISANTKELAHDALLLLSNYLADTLAYNFYYDRLLNQIEKYQIQNAEIENTLIALDIKRPQLLHQQALVEQLIEKYATFFESSRRAETLIATEDTLSSSPIGRLMALQLEIAGLDAQHEQLLRKQKQTDFFRRYYQEALALYQNSGTSKNFFSKLPALLPLVFADVDKTDEVVKEVYNQLLVEAEAARNLYKQSNRQMVKPNLPSTPSTRFALVAAASLLGSLMLASLLVLMRRWWREVTTQNSIQNQTI